MQLAEKLRQRAKQVEAALDGFLPGADTPPEDVHRAMRYCVLGGGKRLRPILVLEAAELVGGRAEDVLPAACGLELIHTYSLIHDDLPCMDDDDYRRGQPSCHKAFGEATAVLTGDALLTLGFELVAANAQNGRSSPGATLRVVTEVARAAGSLGMVGGQVLDLAAEGRRIGLSEMRRIHRMKTGAIFKASVRIGAILAGAGLEEVEALSRWADGFGLVFQITDDILDVVGDERRLGKKTGSDQKHGKATYPSLVGLNEARRLAAEAAAEAGTALKLFGARAQFFLDLLHFVLERDS